MSNASVTVELAGLVSQACHQQVEQLQCWRNESGGRLVCQVPEEGQDGSTPHRWLVAVTGTARSPLQSRSPLKRYLKIKKPLRGQLSTIFENPAQPPIPNDPSRCDRSIAYPGQHLMTGRSSQPAQPSTSAVTFLEASSGSPDLPTTHNPAASETAGPGTSRTVSWWRGFDGNRIDIVAGVGLATMLFNYFVSFMPNIVLALMFGSESCLIYPDRRINYWIAVLLSGGVSGISGPIICLIFCRRFRSAVWDVFSRRP